MELNSADRILTLKIVYYGTALGGKTTNLQTIHRLTDKEGRTELMSIATRDDRTLFFDLLPLGLGRFFGYELKLKLFTVPGQVQFDVTRRKVLAGADAVVFVADSQRSQAEANAASLKNLRVNLIQNKIDPVSLPLALQFNKRDLPDVMPVEEMGKALNERNAPAFAAVATQGPGVMECLAGAVSSALEQIVLSHKLASPAEAKRASGQVRETLLTFAVKSAAVAGAPSGAAAAGRADASWVHKASAKVTDGVDLLEEAVAANLAMSERVSGLRASAARLERRDRQVRALGALARLAEEVSEPATLERELLRQALGALSLTRGSLLAKPANGGLQARSLVGHATDPLATIPSPPLGSVAERLIASGRAQMSNDMLTEVFFGEPRREIAGLFSLMFSPLRTGDSLFAGLFLYGCEPDEPFDSGDTLFVEAACRIVSLARLRALAGASQG